MHQNSCALLIIYASLSTGTRFVWGQTENISHHASSSSSSELNICTHKSLVDTDKRVIHTLLAPVIKFPFLDLAHQAGTSFGLFPANVIFTHYFHNVCGSSHVIFLLTLQEQKKIIDLQFTALQSPLRIFSTVLACYISKSVLNSHSGFFPGFLFWSAEHVASKLSAVKMIFWVKLSKIVHQKWACYKFLTNNWSLLMNNSW